MTASLYKVIKNCLHTVAIRTSLSVTWLLPSLNKICTYEIKKILHWLIKQGIKIILIMGVTCNTVVRKMPVAYLATVKTLRANWCTVTLDGLALPQNCITSHLNASSVNRSKEYWTSYVRSRNMCVVLDISILPLDHVSHLRTSAHSWVVDETALLADCHQLSYH